MIRVGFLRAVSVWAIATLTAVGMAACNTNPGGGVGDPDIDVFPSLIVFNEEDPASTNPATVTVSNTGTRVLAISITAIDGSSAFSITDGNGPLAVAAGRSRNIEITFSTISINTEAALLRIESDDPDESVVEVQLLGGASNVVDRAIDQDRTFGNLFADPNEPDYYIDGSISVTGDITVEPGVMIAYEPGAAFTVQTDGSISLVGTDTAPVVLTGTVETAGNWIGVNIFSNNPRNEIRFAEIAYGGNRLGSGQTVEANVYVQSGASLSISDTSITDGRGYGMAAEQGALITEFERNSFARNQEAAMRIPASVIGALDADSTFAGGNTDEYIEVFPSSVEDDAEWKGQDVPYRFDGVPVIEADVVILPGFAAEFEANAEIRVSADGSISAVGTADNMITFRGAVAAPGTWRSLNVFSSNPLNELTHCVVADAGGSLGSGQSGPACVYIQSGGALAITNTRMENSGGHGLMAEKGASIPEFADNAFMSNTGAAVYIPTALAGMMDSATLFAGGNGDEWVNIDGDPVVDDATWNALDVPYRFEDNSTSIDASVTIEAGATLAFAVDAGLVVSATGSLNADAGGGDPILFTADREYSDGSGTFGFWRSLNFFSNSASNNLDNVIVEFAGGKLGSGQSEAANVYVQSGASVTLTNSIVRFSGGFGAWVENTGTFTESGNTFSNNSSGNVGTP